MPQPTSADSHLDRLRRAAQVAGLDLVSSMSLARLEPALGHAIRDAAGYDDALSALRVVVFGNRGGALWALMSRAERAATHPLDAYSESRVLDAFRAIGSPFDSRLVYPGDCGFSLLALGRACGWGAPSWLGVYIHPDFGTWFAFRAVVVTRLALAESVFAPAPDACLQCATRDCLAACPVDAPGPPGSFALGACSGYRLGRDSPCARRCLAREACPVGTRYRYPAALVEHVYGRSLDSMRRHVRGPAD